MEFFDFLAEYLQYRLNSIWQHQRRKKHQPAPEFRSDFSKLRTRKKLAKQTQICLKTIPPESQFCPQCACARNRESRESREETHFSWTRPGATAPFLYMRTSRTTHARRHFRIKRIIRNIHGLATLPPHHRFHVYPKPRLLFKISQSATGLPK